MARSSTGKSVARAAATGGGTTYRGQMPVNWYAALVLIVILGIGSVALAKYHYAKSSPDRAADRRPDLACRTGLRRLRHHGAGHPGQRRQLHHGADHLG